MTKKISYPAISIIVAILFVFTRYPSVFAADFFFTKASRTAAIGQELMVSLMLNTENGEHINALEGILSYPRTLLDVVRIQDGNSMVNVWIERPHDLSQEVSKKGGVIFSGITPGGYTGKNGKIFSVVFRTKASGKGVIGLEQIKALQNDGNGSEASVKTASFAFTVDGRISPFPLPLIVDGDPPEPFTPILTHDSSVFEGKWFLVFTTQDKGLGIDHYEIRETRDKKESPWVKSESPYVLQDQSLKSTISVKAIDYNGNERVVEIPPRVTGIYTYYIIFAILSVLVVLIYNVLWKKRRRF